ncbi:hypothetical protein TPChic_0009b [Treponema pallidum subsp. pallidum str. Chicago]|nr:hypothetical protein TPChic_0009b [Treponema pallidum subsp. pallidum str. Chicago]
MQIRPSFRWTKRQREKESTGTPKTVSAMTEAMIGVLSHSAGCPKRCYG